MCFGNGVDALDALENFILITLGRDEKFVSVNDKFSEVFGYSRDQIVGQPIDVILGSASRKSTLSLEVDTRETPVLIELKTSFDLPVEAMLIPVVQDTAENKRYMIAFTQPVAGPELSLTNDDLFQQAFGNMSLAIVVISSDGVILKNNAALMDMLGFEPEYFKNKSWLDLVQEDDLQKATRLYQDLLTQKIRNFESEQRMVNAQSESVWAHSSLSLITDASGKVMYALALIKNIQVRKEVEAELKFSKVRIERAIEGASEAVWHWEDINSSGGWWSPAFYDILGYKQGELKPSDETFRKLLHRNDVKRVEKAIVEHFENNTPFDIDYRLRTKSGKFKWVNAKGTAERDDQGKPTGMLGLIADIDALKRTEILLEKRNKALERSNKELENFAYIASHDLQEPLRTICSFLQLFEESLDVPMNEEAKSYLDIVSNASLRMRKLIDDLLVYSRVGRSMDFDRVNTKALLEEVVSDLDSQIMSCEGEIILGDLEEVHSDRNSLYRLFNNLISNAIKFRKADERPLVKITSRTKKRRVEFRIEDNGIGIDPDYHQTVFDIFKKLHTRDEYPGSGMGLSICKKIVGLLGGELSVESSRGQGSTFIFDIAKAK